MVMSGRQMVDTQGTVPDYIIILVSHRTVPDIWMMNGIDAALLTL